MKECLLLLRTFLIVELKSKEILVVALSSVLLISILMAVGAGSAFLDPFTLNKIFPFLFWAVILTSNSISLGRIFENEFRNGILEIFYLSKTSLQLVYLAKLLVVVIILFITKMLGLLVMSVIFQIDFMPSLLPLLLVCLILSFAYSSLGLIMSAISHASRVKASLLPVILIPCSFPLYFASLELTYLILENNQSIFTSVWFGFSVFMAVLYSFLGALLFPASVKAQF